MTYKIRILAAAALAALLAAGPAAAQNSGWYIGGGGGMTNAKFTQGDFSGLATGTFSADDSEFAPRFFGGYRVTQNWGVEFGLAGLGKYNLRYNNGASGTAVYEYTSAALTVALAARLQLASSVWLTGRAGLAFTASALDLKVNNGTANPPLCTGGGWSDCTSTSTNPYWGVGGQFDITPRWAVRLDYDNYGEVGDEFETGRAKIDTVSMSVQFAF
ncbi:MAG TPA: outer membrane beta-barrel protein [Burkholderiales bacterium]|nr:outer membrane beta-barrel protein [Burkholderiales bacterium]